MLQKAIDSFEDTLYFKQIELKFVHKQTETVAKAKQLEKGGRVGEVDLVDLKSLQEKLEEQIIVQRDLDLLQIAEQMISLGLLNSDIASLLLFDIYRGIFSEQTVTTSKVTSKFHANAKLKLLNLLLIQLKADPKGCSTQSYMNSLVKGIYREICESHASKIMNASIGEKQALIANSSKGFDTFLEESEQYQLMLDAVETLLSMCHTNWFKDVHEAYELLLTTQKLLERRIYNYKVLETF